jgi:hypothetical protein
VSFAFERARVAARIYIRSFSLLVAKGLFEIWASACKLVSLLSQYWRRAALAMRYLFAFCSLLRLCTAWTVRRANSVHPYKET